MKNKALTKVTTIFFVLAIFIIVYSLILGIMHKVWIYEYVLIAGAFYWLSTFTAWIEVKNYNDVTSYEAIVIMLGATVGLAISFIALLQSFLPSFELSMGGYIVSFIASLSISKKRQ